MPGFVELAGCNAESTHEKQNHTQDRKNTRGPYSPCKQRKGRGEEGRAGRNNSVCMKRGEREEKTKQMGGRRRGERLEGG